MVVVMRNSSRCDQIATCKSAFQEAIKGFECDRRESDSRNGAMGYLRNCSGSKAAINASLAIRDTPARFCETDYNEKRPFTKFQPKRYLGENPKSMFPHVKFASRIFNLLVTLTRRRVSPRRHNHCR